MPRGDVIRNAKSALVDDLLQFNKKSSKDFVEEIFSSAGIEIDGSRPWDLYVYDERFYDRLLTGGSLALGESYTEGWWESPDLSEFICCLLRARLDESVNPWRFFLQRAKASLLNLQEGKRVFASGGAQHYNLGNDFYELMLDQKMIYTCGYWKNAKNLNEAQEDKLKLVCDKLELKPGLKLLDIGCGWGGFLRYAVKNYGVSGVGITISEEQARYAREKNQGLDIEIKITDYRELTGRFDRVASLGMFEHVGYKNYRDYMLTIFKHLSPDGLFLLHTIGANKSDITTDPWIDKYIFSDAMLPSIAQLGKSIEGLFVMEDWHNFGLDYDKTLLAWFHNFHKNWAQFQDKLGDEFYRKWKYYLLFCAGSFRARRNQLWQIVLSPESRIDGYESLR